MKLLTLSALLGVVAAVVDPSDPCAKKINDSDFNTTVSSQADVELLKTCTKINSNLVIDLEFPGLAQFSSVQEVDGAIVVGNLGQLGQGFENIDTQDSKLTGLSFPLLYMVDDLQILGVRDLKTLDFPTINSIRHLALINLPSLESWNGFETLNYSAYASIINTGLSTIIWNSSETRDVYTGNIRISNNTNLELVNLLNPTEFDTLEVHGNGNTIIGIGAEIVRMLTITGCGGYADYNYGLGDGFNDIRYISELYGPDGWIRIWNNTFKQIAFESLERVNGSVEIHSNPNLVNVSMGFLGRVEGSLDITDNDSLKRIRFSDLSYLDDVQGSVNFTGAFEDITLNEQLKVKYGFEIRSTANISCQHWDFKYQNGFFAYGDSYSRYGCAANGDPIYYSSASTNSTSGDGGSSGKKHGLSRQAFWAIVIAIPVPIGLGFWIGLIWWLCVRHKKKKNTTATTVMTENKNLNQVTNVPTQQGPAPIQYYGAAPPHENGHMAVPVQNGAVPERKPLAVSGVRGVTGDQASSLTVGEPERKSHNDVVLSTHSSISRDSRHPGELERREEELRDRERVIEEMERERRAEDLDARERALADREREIRAWDEQRRRSGPMP